MECKKGNRRINLRLPFHISIIVLYVNYNQYMFPFYEFIVSYLSIAV